MVVGDDGVDFKTMLWKNFDVGIEDAGEYKCVGEDEDVIQAEVFASLNVLGNTFLIQCIQIKPYKIQVDETKHMLLQ